MEDIVVRFLEFGKYYDEERTNASDFYTLAYTRGLTNSRDLLDVVFTPEPGRTIFWENVRQRRSPFSLAILNYYPLTVGYDEQEAPIIIPNIFFAFVQARAENEFFAESRKSRLFYQHRFCLIPQTDYLALFSAGRKKPLLALLKNNCDPDEQKSDKFVLKTYEEIEEAQEILHLDLSDRDLDIKSDEDCLLYGEDEKIILPENIKALADALIDVGEKGQVRVVGELSLVEKLKIIDAVQRLVYHTDVGWLRCALDDVSRSNINLLFVSEPAHVEDKVIPWGNFFVKILNWKEIDSQKTISSYIQELPELYPDQSFLEVNKFLFSENLRRGYKKFKKQVLFLIKILFKRNVDDFLKRNLAERQFIVNLPGGIDFVVNNMATVAPFWDCVDTLLLHDDVQVIQTCVVRLLEGSVNVADTYNLELICLKGDEKASKKLEKVLANIFELGNGKVEDLMRYLALSRMVLSFVSTDRLIKWVIKIYKDKKNLPNHLDILARNISENHLTESVIVLGLFTATVMKKRDDTVRFVDEWMRKVLAIQNITFAGIKFLQGIPDIREELKIGYWGALSDIQKESGLPIGNEKKLLLWQILIERELKNFRNPYRWLKEEDIPYVRTQKDVASQLLKKYIELSDFETLQKMMKDRVVSIENFDEEPVEFINAWLVYVVRKNDVLVDEVDFYVSLIQKHFGSGNLSKEAYEFLFTLAVYEKNMEKVSLLLKEAPYVYEKMGDAQYVTKPEARFILLQHISEQDSDVKIFDPDFDFLLSSLNEENP